MGVQLTWIAEVVLSMSEDFKGTGEVEEVHVVVHGEKNLDGLIFLAPNCTHLAGCSSDLLRAR